VSVRAAATHGVLAGPAVARLKESDITEVVVTDTVPIPDEKRFDRLRVISVAHLFAAAIGNIHDGRSISALFR
jgi:ribose-phosphate pyrophosphokinase